MSVVFDNATLNSGTASGANFSYTTGSSSNRFMVLEILVNNSITASSVTYNGVACSLVDSTNTGAGGQAMHLFYLINPDSGTNNVVVTTSDTSSWEGMVATYSSSAQMAPEASAKANTQSSPVTATVTTISDNAWVVGMFRNTTGTFSAGANTVLRGGATGINIADTNGDQTPPGSHDLNISFNGGGVCGWIAISLAPAAQVLTMQADSGAYVLTGNSVILGRSRRMIASVGSYILTGIDATFRLVGWTNQSKNSSSFTNSSKSASSWVNDHKN